MMDLIDIFYVDILDGNQVASLVNNGILRFHLSDSASLEVSSDIPITVDKIWQCFKTLYPW